MTRNEFVPFMETIFNQLRALFTNKNHSYGQTDDAFFNFRETARRHLGGEDYPALFKALSIMKDKHAVALANKGLDDPEVEQRLLDQIVYDLLALAMYREYRKVV